MKSDTNDEESCQSNVSHVDSPRWHQWIPIALPIVLLIPFLNKAFHIDDTTYIYIAQHLLNHPLDYFGFNINWTGSSTPVWVFNKNPPGFSYFLAPLGALFGWREFAMHAAQLIPTITASLGIYQLAKRLSSTPLLAVVLAIATPNFIVSSSSVMVEPIMLACYVWAIVFWIKATDQNDPRYFVAAALLIGFGALSKYVALTAIPLLIAYTIARERRVSRTLFFMLIPATMLALFDLSAVYLYGQSLLGGTAGATSSETYDSTLQYIARNLLYGLSFTGASFVSVIFVAPLLHQKKTLGLLILVFMLTLTVVTQFDGIIQQSWIQNDEGYRWGFLLQLSLATTTGIYIFALAVNDVLRKRDESSLLLALLIFGIFVFSTFLNWTVNARSILPMLPAIAIVVARQFDSLPRRPSPIRIAIPLLAGVLISLAVGYGDYRYAGTAREFTHQLKENPDTNFAKTWFVGHWGFQYYMENEGARAVDWSFARGSGVDKPEAGDTIAWWTGQYKSFPDIIRIKDMEVIKIPASDWITTMNKSQGAGFYMSTLGPLPYYFGASSPDHFVVFTVDDPPYTVTEFVPERRVVTE